MLKRYNVFSLVYPPPLVNIAHKPIHGYKARNIIPIYIAIKIFASKLLFHWPRAVVVVALRPYIIKDNWYGSAARVFLGYCQGFIDRWGYRG